MAKKRIAEIISTSEVNKIVPQRKITFRRVFWPLFFIALFALLVLAIVFAVDYFRS